MNKEQLDYKLNMIFNELIDIRGMLEEQQRDKRKIKAKEQIEYGNRELEEIRYISSQWYDAKQNRIREFNYKLGED